MWSDHTIWWHVYPMGFTGAPVRPSSDAERALTHRLRHIIGWLDYLVELGANGLLLGPIFASESHGYDTIDYRRIDPRLGDDADFDLLITECNARGIKVMLDGVFNHVGVNHPLFQQAMAGGLDGPDAGLFHLYPGGNYEMFEGHPELPTFNHSDPRVADLVADVMIHWLRRGASAWRLDAAYAVRPEFWAKVLPRVRAEFGEAWVMGEVIHGDYAEIVATSGLDSLTQYWLWKAIWSSLKDANFYELDWAIKQHDELLATYLPFTFVGNHDVTRIATQVGPEKAALAAVILLTLGGAPAIYYGDEQAFTAEKVESPGGDDGVRPMFPDRPDQLFPLGAWMLRLHQQLIGIRRRNPWLTWARCEQVSLTNESYAYDMVAGDERLHVSLDVTGTPSARITAASGEVLFSYPN